MQGKIIRGIAGFYYVYVEGFGEVECKAKGAFRNQKIKPLVGDDVTLVIIDEEKKTGNIVSIEKRKSELIRPAVANIDQALVIFAVTDPEPNYNLLDRFLVMMEQNHIPSLICFNKSDKADEAKKQEIRDHFVNTDYQVLFTNAITGEGVDVVKRQLDGKATVLAGPSGVGKSSLTNLLQSSVSMATGTISEKIKRGKHTTRHSEFITMGNNTFLLDTPGFSSLYLTGTDELDLKYYYPEFMKFYEKCRFHGCNHINEPGCAVKEALQQKKISNSRYENYKLIFEELKNSRKY